MAIVSHFEQYHQCVVFILNIIYQKGLKKFNIFLKEEIIRDDAGSQEYQNLDDKIRDLTFLIDKVEFSIRKQNSQENYTPNNIFSNNKASILLNQKAIQVKMMIMKGQNYQDSAIFDMEYLVILCQRYIKNMKMKLVLDKLYQFGLLQDKSSMIKIIQDLLNMLRNEELLLNERLNNYFDVENKIVHILQNGKYMNDDNYKQLRDKLDSLINSHLFDRKNNQEIQNAIIQLDGEDLQSALLCVQNTRDFIDNKSIILQNSIKSLQMQVQQLQTIDDQISEGDFQASYLECEILINQAMETQRIVLFSQDIDDLLESATQNILNGDEMEEACEKVDQMISIVDGFSYEMVATAQINTEQEQATQDMYNSRKSLEKNSIITKAEILADRGNPKKSISQIAKKSQYHEKLVNLKQLELAAQGTENHKELDQILEFQKDMLKLEKSQLEFKKIELQKQTNKIVEQIDSLDVDPRDSTQQKLDTIVDQTDEFTKEKLLLAKREAGFGLNTNAKNFLSQAAYESELQQHQVEKSLDSVKKQHQNIKKTMKKLKKTDEGKGELVAKALDKNSKEMTLNQPIVSINDEIEQIKNQALNNYDNNHMNLLLANMDDLAKLNPQEQLPIEQGQQNLITGEPVVNQSQESYKQPQDLYERDRQINYAKLFATNIEDSISNIDSKGHEEIISELIEIKNFMNNQRINKQCDLLSLDIHLSTKPKQIMKLFESFTKFINLIVQQFKVFKQTVQEYQDGFINIKESINKDPIDEIIIKIDESKKYEVNDVNVLLQIKNTKFFLKKGDRKNALQSLKSVILDIITLKNKIQQSIIIFKIIDKWLQKGIKAAKYGLKIQLKDIVSNIKDILQQQLYKWSDDEIQSLSQELINYANEHEKREAKVELFKLIEYFKKIQDDDYFKKKILSTKQKFESDSESEDSSDSESEFIQSDEDDDFEK